MANPLPIQPAQTGQEPGLMNPTKGQPYNPSKTASADNQAQYDMFMAYAYRVIHNEKFSDNIAETIQGYSGDIDSIIDFIANSALSVVQRLESAAEDKGVVIADNVKANAAGQIVDEISIIADMAMERPLTKEEKGKALSLTVSMYLDQAVKSGKMTKEELIEASQALQKGPEGQKFAKTRADILAGAGKPPQPEVIPRQMQSSPVSPGGGIIAPSPKGGM